MRDRLEPLGISEKKLTSLTKKIKEHKRCVHLDGTVRCRDSVLLLYCMRRMQESNPNIPHTLQRSWERYRTDRRRFLRRERCELMMKKRRKAIQRQANARADAEEAAAAKAARIADAEETAAFDNWIQEQWDTRPLLLCYCMEFVQRRGEVCYKCGNNRCPWTWLAVAPPAGGWNTGIGRLPS